MQQSPELQAVATFSADVMYCSRAWYQAVATFSANVIWKLRVWEVILMT